MDKLIIEYVADCRCSEGDFLWVDLYYGNTPNKRQHCCFSKRSNTEGWKEWQNGPQEPDMPSDSLKLFRGSPGERALNALLAKTSAVYKLTIPKKHNMPLKTKTTAKPGDKFLVVAEYDAEGFIRIGNAIITGFSQLTCYEYPEHRSEPYRPFVPGDIVYVDSWEGHPAYDVADADAPLYCWNKVILLDRHESEDGTIGVPDEKDPDTKTRWIHCSHLKLLAKAEDNNAWIVNTDTGFKIYSCEDGVKAQRAVIDCADDAGREAIEQHVIDYCKGLCDEIRAAAVNRYKAKYENE